MRPLFWVDPIMGRPPEEEGEGLTHIRMARLPAKYLEVVD